MKPIVPPERILLVPTDFGAAAARALSLALELAPRLGADVVLAHVYEVPIYAYPSGALVPLPRLQAGIAEDARRAVADVAAQAGVLRALCLEGDPVTRILELIAELRPLVVVMGTHARAGLLRLLMGSVAEVVVRRSTSPVLTVRASHG